MSPETEVEIFPLGEFPVTVLVISLSSLSTSVNVLEILMAEYDKNKEEHGS